MQFRSHQCNAIQCRLVESSTIYFSAMQCSAEPTVYFTTVHLKCSHSVPIFKPWQWAKWPREIVNRYCNVMYYNMLHCTLPSWTSFFCNAVYHHVLNCSALHCIVIYYIELYCTVLSCISLWCTALYCHVLHCSVLHCIVMYFTVVYCTVLSCTALFCATMYFHVLHCAVL